MKGANRINKGFYITLIIIIIAVALILATIFTARTINLYSDNQTSSRPDVRTESHVDSLNIVAHCDDGVVCYRPCSGYGCSISCIKDPDLVEKYCEEFPK